MSHRRGLRHIPQNCICCSPKGGGNIQKGRVFLAGDAAHINNPLGGMGMNGGIHDALNLSEKLVKVWNGKAVDSELDKYDAQRRPIAIDYVQQTTIRNKAMLEETIQTLVGGSTTK